MKEFIIGREADNKIVRYKTIEEAIFLSMKWDIIFAKTVYAAIKKFVKQPKLDTAENLPYDLNKKLKRKK